MKYVAFEYNKVIADYLTVFPEEKQLLDTLTNEWKDPFTAGSLFLAGGFVMKLYNKMPFGTSDIDVWTPNSRDYVHAMVEAITDKGWEIKDESDYSITMDLHLGRDVQFIKKRFGKTIEKITSSFDFTNCKCYTDFLFVYVHEKAVDCLAKNKLKDGQPQNPYLHLERTKKYVGLGFKPAGVLKRKIHEARLIELNLKLETKEEIVTEAAPMPEVQAIRRNQQLPPVMAAPPPPQQGYVLQNIYAGNHPQWVQYQGGVAGGAYGGGGGEAVAPHVGGIEGAWAEAVDVAPVFDDAPEAVEPIDPIHHVPIAFRRNPYLTTSTKYSSLHNMGMFLPKYAAWLKKENDKKQEEEYRKMYANRDKYAKTLYDYAYRFDTNTQVDAQNVLARDLAEQGQAIARQGQLVRSRDYYIAQNQAPRGPRQGR